MTNFGQTHGVEDRRLIIDALRLPFLKTDLVVQIELDGLSPSVKRKLFSTTRDRLKRGSRYNALIEATWKLSAMIRNSKPRIHDDVCGCSKISRKSTTRNYAAASRS